MLLKYLNNFWRSIETLLINFKVELKLRSTKHCILTSAGVKNDDADSNNISFTKCYVPVVTL